jgi:hypothetical protein
MKQQDDLFINSVQAALYSFQMLEEALKIIVGLSYEVIQAITPEPVKFNFNPDEIYNAPLGNLKKMYSRVSDNSGLGKEIDQLIPWRNYCAHRAFQVEYLSRNNVNKENEKDIDGLITATKATLQILLKLKEELQQVQQLHSRVVKTSQRDTGDNIKFQGTLKY